MYQALLQRLGPQLAQMLQRGGSLASRAGNAMKPALEHRSAIPMMMTGAGGLALSDGALGPQMPPMARPTPQPDGTLGPQTPYAAPSVGPYGGATSLPGMGEATSLPGPGMATNPPQLGLPGVPQPMAQPSAQRDPWAGLRDPWAGLRDIPGSPMNSQSPAAQAPSAGNRDFMERILMQFAKNGARTGLSPYRE